MPEDELKRVFPGLRTAKWKITSAKDYRYNCIAWAAEDTRNWWWPSIFRRPNGVLDHWPIPNRVETLEAFIAAFETLGFRECRSPHWLPGFEKVAIYADRDMTPTHMARQTFWGGWLSKLGRDEDIYHRRVEDVQGSTDPILQEYGVAVRYMKRSWFTVLKRRYQQRRRLAGGSGP